MERTLTDLDRGNQLFIGFIGEHLEEVKATQTISQRLAEAAEGPCMTHFEDIVPKPYQEFKDILPKSPLKNSWIRRNGTMPSNSSQMLRCLALRSTLWNQFSRSS